MAKIHAYLNFNGTCEQAFTFYSSVFKKELLGTYRFGELPEDPNHIMKDEDKNKIMHTALMVNDYTMLMGSDCLESFGHKSVSGNSTYIMLDIDTAEEAKELYHLLSKDAQHLEMELSEQFWAELYASFTDKFGIPWMIHYEGNKKNNI